MKFYEEALQKTTKKYKNNLEGVIVTKMNENCYIIENEFINCIIKIKPSYINNNLTIHTNRKMDILRDTLQKTLQKLSLKIHVEIFILSISDHYKHIFVYTSKILTKVISDMLNLHLKITLLSKFNSTILIDPSAQELDFIENYFYQVKQGDILYLESFNYNDIENDGLYEEIYRKINQ